MNLLHQIVLCVALTSAVTSGRTVNPKANLSFKEKLALENLKKQDKQDLAKVTPSKITSTKESASTTERLSVTKPKYVESALFREQFTTTTTTPVPDVAEIIYAPSVPLALGGMVTEEGNDSADRFNGFHLGFRPSFPGWELISGDDQKEAEAEEEALLESDDSVSRFSGFHLGFRPSFPGWDLIPSDSVSELTNSTSAALEPVNEPSSPSATVTDAPEDTSSFDYDIHIVRPSDISSFAGELDAFGGDKAASEYNSAIRPFGF